MAEHYRFMDAVLQEDGTYDREYDAQDFTDYFKALVTTGVMKGAGYQLAVSSNGSNMVTKVDTGVAFILGRYYENDSFIELTHDTETLGNSRIDRIVIRMDLSPNKRHVLSFIKKGTPSGNPVPPTLVQTESIYEISLAQVRIIGGQTFIGSNAVTDERGKDVICPWAGSNILPSFDNNALGDHIKDDTMHIKWATDTSTTAATANIKNLLLDGVTEYKDGMAVSFAVAERFAGVGSVLININGLGNKNLRRPNGSNMPASLLYKNGIYTMRYSAATQGFIVQGEGGEYGNATAAQVLAGCTFGTENGLVSGTMPNNSGYTIAGAKRGASGSGFLDVVPPKGYYDGANNSRTSITDTFFTAANIKKGVPIFGVIGTLGEKYATGQAYSTTGSVEYITIHNLGFRPRVVIAKVANLSDKNRYAAVYMLSPYVFGDLDFRIADNGTVYANSSTQYISANTFRLQVDSINSRLYNWVAFGSEDLSN